MGVVAGLLSAADVVANARPVIFEFIIGVLLGGTALS
jgi:hypothetical protein